MLSVRICSIYCIDLVVQIKKNSKTDGEKMIDFTLLMLLIEIKRMTVL